jgi:cation transport ATPase
MSENDWTTQLKKIEREFDGLPPEPSPGAIRAQSEAERRAQQSAQERSAALGASARLFLVLALGGAIFLWPYARDCGSGLFTFIAVEAVLVVGGLWVAIYAWRHRMPKTHMLSLLLALGGLVLIAGEVLPRNGYAAVDPRNPPQWWCAKP